jgi:hypothetical protein
MTTGKYYTIRLPDGGYVSKASSGYSSPRSVPLRKAKLWANLGHIKTHLGMTGTKYPTGSQIVEVGVVYSENVIDTVDSLVAENQRRAAERKREGDLRTAKYNLEYAERNLAEAKARMQKVAP